MKGTAISCYVLYESTTTKRYSKWSDGLIMVISKGNQRIELTSKEIELLVATLPKTVGGTY